MLHRVDRYMQTHEADGVVMDWRVVILASEAARLSVVPQLLGYAELYRVRPSCRIRRDIADRADYLLARFDELHSGTVFDGMLGYAFFEAYEATGDPRYMAQGLSVIDELVAIPRSEYILNGGLMAAMAFAKHYALTGDVRSADLARVVLNSLPAFQNVDGSFPHWCPCSKDVHYSDWMATELILIGRLMSDPLIDPTIEKIRGFIEQRVGPDGNTSYEEPCDDYPGCVTYYYSIATGCGIDVDSRAFTNELGYSVLLFDHTGSPEYRPVMRFLRSLESGGTWGDKWDFWPPPEDPYYVWTAAETSVVNTSLLFWNLASTLSGRRHVLDRRDAWNPDAPATEIDDIEVEPVVSVPRVPAPALALASRAPDDGESPRWRSPVDALVAARVAPLSVCGQVSGAPAAPPTDHPGSRAEPMRASSATPAGEVALGLQAVAPNPARDGCTIRFALAASSVVTAVVFDPSGRRVRTLLEGRLEAGAHLLHWDGRDDAGRTCGNAVYFVRVRTGRTEATERVLVLR
jgi:hypothetical protein